MALRRTPISPREKYDICVYSEQNPRASQQFIAQYFSNVWHKSISRRAVCNIIAEKEKWMLCAELDPNCLRLRSRSGKYEHMENALHIWILQRQSETQYLTEEEIRTQAKLIGDQLQIKDFNYSNGWLHGFKKRRGLVPFTENAPKDNVGVGETAWPAQNNVASPGPSRKADMQPRPSTSRKPDSMQRPSTSTSSGYMKPDPGTPPHSLQSTPMMMHHSFVDTPPSQPPPLMQPQQPRLLPKPMGVPQQQPRLRVRPPPPAQLPPEPEVEEPQQVCLRWNSFHSNMQTMFPSLLNREKFVDVTLACEGRSIKCHKVVLSSCSAYLERLLSENPCKHPIIMMPSDLRFWQLRALVNFMYRGEVNVEHEQLASLLAAAEALQIKGLAGPSSSLPDQEDEQEDRPVSPRPKRKRTASPPPVRQQPPPVQRMPVSPPRTTSPPLLPNSSAVSITRLAARTQPSVVPARSRSPPSHMDIRANSPGIEITPVVSFEEVKMEPIDISDSNDESMDQLDTHPDFDMEKDYPAGEEENLESGGEEDYEDDGGGGDDPSLPSTSSHADPGTHNGNDDITDTADLDHQEANLDNSEFPENSTDLGLNLEENPPDLGDDFNEDELHLSSEPPDETNPIDDETNT